MSIAKIIDWNKTFQKERVSSPFHSDLVSQHWIDEKNENENEIGLSK